MLKFQQFDPRSGEFTEANPCLMAFGITEALVPIIAGLATSAGVGTATAGTIASIAAPALVDAGVGAGVGAIAGNPGAGALAGAGYGALGPSLGALGVGTAGQGTTDLINGALGLGNATTGAAIPTGGATYDTSAAQLGQGADTSLTDSNPLTQTAAKIGGNNGSLSGVLGGNGGIGGLKGTLALLAAAAQMGNRPNTTAPTGATANDPYNTSGYLNRAPATGYTPTTGSWYNYGTAGEPQFFSGNQLHLARGGAISRAMRDGQYSRGGAFSTGGTFDTKRGDFFVQGDGSGQEDNVDAKLSPGEVVWDAGTVSAVGDGNSEEGARRLMAARDKIAEDKGFKQNVQPKLKKSPLTYLRDAA